MHLVHRVQIMKFFLPEPSGPTRKSLKKPLNWSCSALLLVTDLSLPANTRSSVSCIVSVLNYLLLRVKYGIAFFTSVRGNTCHSCFYPIPFHINFGLYQLIYLIFFDL